MNEKDIEMFRKLFAEYCKKEMKAGRCYADGCEFCPVNGAMNKIFNSQSDEGEYDGENE